MACTFGGWLEFVWARWDEPYESISPLVRGSPITLYQVVDSGTRSPSYVTPDAMRNMTCGECCRRRFMPNRGREAPSYLRYIAERYDTLPQWVIFLQGKPHGDPSLLNRVSDCLWREEPREWTVDAAADFLPIVPTIYVTDRSLHYEDWQPGYTELWNQWGTGFPFEETPHLPRSPKGIRTVSFECCAQFLASRRALRKNPRQLYEVGSEVALTFDGASAEKATQLDKRANFGLNWAGSAFEHIWHVLLGQPARMEKHCNPCSRGGANRHGMSAYNASGPFHCCVTTRENCPQPSRRMDAPRPRLSARRRRPRFGGDDNHRTLVIQKDGSTCEISNGKMINCWR